MSKKQKPIGNQAVRAVAKILQDAKKEAGKVMRGGDK